MASKDQKKTDVLQKRLTKLRQQLSGETKQADDQAEIARLRKEVQAAEEELKRIKKT